MTDIVYISGNISPDHSEELQYIIDLEKKLRKDKRDLLHAAVLNRLHAESRRKRSKLSAEILAKKVKKVKKTKKTKTTFHAQTYLENGWTPEKNPTPIVVSNQHQNLERPTVRKEAKRSKHYLDQHDNTGKIKESTFKISGKAQSMSADIDAPVNPFNLTKEELLRRG